MTVHYKPNGCNTVSPYLVVENIPKTVDFLKRAFGAEEREQLALPDGTVNHAMVSIGDSTLMLGAARAGDAKPSSSKFYVYVKDIDAGYRTALAAGATSLVEPAIQFYGDRNAGVKDPDGNSWWIATRVEEVPHAELLRRNAAQKAKRG
jgi:PhnB protein